MARPHSQSPQKKVKVVYVTSSEYKREENRVFVQHCTLNGIPVKDAFEFELRNVPIRELLEVDLTVMVREEVLRAYRQIQVPCIVEHAGLIFEDYRGSWYPGGLTKPMWNTLGDQFLKETNSAGRKAVARAVVAYCDGKRSHTFVGDTPGILAESPRGSRKFYWDTVFIPDDPSGKMDGKTYAEICDDGSTGLLYKVTHLSQSSRAMIEFLNFLRDNPPPDLWHW